MKTVVVILVLVVALLLKRSQSDRQAIASLERQVQALDAQVQKNSEIHLTLGPQIGDLVESELSHRFRHHPMAPLGSA